MKYIGVELQLELYMRLPEEWRVSWEKLPQQWLNRKEAYIPYTFPNPSSRTIPLSQTTRTSPPTRVVWLLQMDQYPNNAQVSTAHNGTVAIVSTMLE